MAPWAWTVILFFAACLLALLELFIPSGGLLGIMAFLALAGSIVFSFMLHPLYGAAYIAILLVIVPLFIWRLIDWWPRTFIGRRVLLDQEDDPALETTEEKERFRSLIGRLGLTKSRMMPSGVIEIDGIRYDAVTDGTPLDPGKPIVVVRADGINIIVRETKETASSVSKTLPREIEDPFQ